MVSQRFMVLCNTFSIKRSVVKHKMHGNNAFLFAAFFVLYPITLLTC